MIDKNKVQSNFDSASDSYESVALVQNECAHILIQALGEYLPNFYPASILDLGTGTGYIPQVLLEYYTQSIYMLNDIAPKMIEVVKHKFNKYHNISFHIGDMEEVEFQKHDLIISNFAMQWVHCLNSLLYKLYLKSDVLAFSCLLEGTFLEWEIILQKYGLASPLKKYPTQQELIAFFVSKGIEHYIFEKEFQLVFAHANDFISYLKKLGASASETQIQYSAIKMLIQNHTHTFSVTYKVGFVIIKRDI